MSHSQQLLLDPARASLHSLEVTCSSGGDTPALLLWCPWDSWQPWMQASQPKYNVFLNSCPRDWPWTVALGGGAMGRDVLRQKELNFTLAVSKLKPGLKTQKKPLGLWSCWPYFLEDREELEANVGFVLKGSLKNCVPRSWRIWCPHPFLFCFILLLLPPWCSVSA